MNLSKNHIFKVRSGAAWLLDGVQEAFFSFRPVSSSRARGIVAGRAKNEALVPADTVFFDNPERIRTSSAYHVSVRNGDAGSPAPLKRLHPSGFSAHA